MRLLFLVAFVVIGANAASLFDYTLVQEWKTFKLKHHKNYGSLYEETLRMRIYAQNRIVIARHNQRFQQGLESFEMDVNQFSDLLAEEFRRTMLGVRPMGQIAQGGYEKLFQWIPPQDDVKLASNFDWRNRGAVTRVKNQGQCGSCWAFSATGALESQWFLRRGKLVGLSEQNLMDCSKKDFGCGGGVPSRAYEYIKAAGGINLERDYPYQEKQNKQCKFNRSAVAATVKGVYYVPRTEKALTQAVAIKGPMSVVIRYKDSFQHYRRGVYYEAKCTWGEALAPYHAMLVVGYGKTSDGVAYWLVKNSWGKYWGDSGYIKMARNRNNMCGIANMVVFPII
ncbi:procathepsin L-like [Anopheles ziemanni]|uniref:procathepsin L-like n=1 Tax=Anopheles coustani TaxID=139045 RepID=UPI00265ABF04|nr:procathepsin L-like [Anopheles coustani]XP_058177463.1 procathepsin L-like [Anopheles ziemanni]